jgi:hypothetical protein
MRKLILVMVWLMVATVTMEEVEISEGLGSVSRLVTFFCLAVALLPAVALDLRQRFAWRSTVVLLFGFAAWCTLGLQWSDFMEFSLPKVLRLWQMVGVFLLVAHVARTPAGMLHVLRAWVAGVTVLALDSLVCQVLGINRLTDRSGEITSQVMGLWLDPNDGSLTMALAIPMAYYLHFTEPRRWLRFCYVALVPLLAAGIVWSGSRTGIVALAISLLGSFALVGGKSYFRRTAVAAALVSIGWALSAFMPQSSLERYQTIEAEVARMSFGGRFILWEAGLEAFKSAPLTGVGPACFIPAVAGEVLKAKVAHNVFMSVMVETGLVGLLLYGGFLFSIVRRLLRAPRAERNVFLVVFAVWLIAATFATWDVKKVSYIVLALCFSAGAHPVAPVAPATRRSVKVAFPGQEERTPSPARLVSG